jgi:hypothetical protein
MGRSPCSTCTVTALWLSDAVEKVSLRLVGIVVLRGMSAVITPPSVSMPSESGVTSSSRMSFTSPASTPACTAAPSATTSSGFTPWWGSLPKNLRTASCTIGHAGRAADEDDLVDVRRGLARVLEGLAARPEGLLDEVADELLELGPGEAQVQVLGARGVRREERQVDVGLGDARQLDLGALGGLLQALQDHAIVADVDAVLLLELGDQVVDDALVEVVAAEVGVAVGEMTSTTFSPTSSTEMSKVPPPRS